MPIPVSQMWTVARYVMGQRLRGRRRFPLVLMLEPLFRCNLACAGCGKIQHPTEVLRQQLSPTQCFEAAEECGAPIVSIPGGEPLLHPDIVEIVDGLIDRGKYVYLCTNALLLEKALPQFTPSKHLTFSVHLDGPAEEHDIAVCRDGVYDVAESAIVAAIDAGFRVTTNTTVFNTAQPERFHPFFDRLMRLGVEGMMISPGYPYEKAPDQEHFLHRNMTVDLFRRLLANRPRRWRFNQSPLFLEFLQGRWDLPCTPWGNPTYNLFGWQRPCYLLQEGAFAGTYAELINQTDWESYGPDSGHPACSDCMVHSGFEPTAVTQTFGSWKGFWATARSVLIGPPRTPTAEPDAEMAPSDILPLPVVAADESYRRAV